MRVLVSANPMFGHVNPLLPIARAAVRAGHDVVFATGADMVEHVRRHGVDAVAVGPTYAAARTVDDEPWLDWFARVAKERVDELVSFATGWSPDIVVHDETELAGAVAAAVTDARHVIHGLGIPPPAALWASLLPAIVDLGRRWPSVDVAQRFSSATYLDVCPPSLAGGRATAGGPAFWTDTRPVRPTAAAGVGAGAGAGAHDDAIDAIAATDDAIERLRPASTVHLTLGTVFNRNPRLLRVVLDGLARHDLDVVVTTGRGWDQSALGPLPANVVVRDYVPHGVLLARCALVVSHGGAGVMFGALQHGLPQLLLPQGADQFGNASACVEAGAALSLVGEQVTAESIADAVDRLLADERFVVSAARLRAEIEALPSADAVLAELTRVEPV